MITAGHRTKSVDKHPTKIANFWSIHLFYKMSKHFSMFIISPGVLYKNQKGMFGQLHYMSRKKRTDQN